jgi:hypothetical protein
MGWASGSYLCDDVWTLVKRYIPEDKRKRLAGKLIDIFDDHDADDWEGTKVWAESGRSSNE